MMAVIVNVTEDVVWYQYRKYIEVSTNWNKLFLY